MPLPLLLRFRGLQVTQSEAACARLGYGGSRLLYLKVLLPLRFGCMDLQSNHGGGSGVTLGCVTPFSVQSPQWWDPGTSFHGPWTSLASKR